MAMRVSGAAIGEIHALFRWGSMGAWTDGQLMAQFLAGHEGSEPAFRVLMHRHGPMVLGVCRRILGDEHAAEDAFQATFLVLVKKARTLQDCGLLTNWLYGVASRVASKERVRGARRRVVERQAAEQSARPGEDLNSRELSSVIDEEIRRLPERYRLPLVLCHLEGLRHEEVAERLGCPVGTVESRLSRARQRLRSRLARRGLAPCASAMGAVLRPPAALSIRPSLIEATLQAAIEHAAHRAAVASAGATSLIKRAVRLVPSFNARAGGVASALVAGVSIAAISLGVLQAGGETPRTRPPAPPVETELPAAKEQVPAITQGKPAIPRRSAVAVAAPVSGITVDGRLDDWPGNLPWYPVRNQLLGHPDYDSESRESPRDPDASFQVGYDREAGLIYLAVVVRDADEDVVVHPSSVLHTDAVEVYIDSFCGEGKISRIPVPSGDWRKTLDAAKMPVLQYAAVPGEVSAYGDPWGANPSLVYARTRETRTKMQYRTQGDVTTYEWAIQAYDHYPDQPTRLSPGKRLGFDVAVVDKDSEGGRPAWMSWGDPLKVFKGCDAESLGELDLAGGP
jgi:RNA polymerase sigma factor (sigma-70 family)